ncbi:MAG: ribonuclease P protein component [Bacteroidia bacterium]
MIKSSETISELFSEIPAKNKLGRDFLFARFLHEQNHPGVKIVIVVGKRFFKRAVDRNLIKRRIREAIRLNGNDLNDADGLALLIIFRSKKIEPFDRIDKAIKELFTSLNTQLESNS